MRRIFSGAGWAAGAALIRPFTAQPVCAISGAVNSSTRMVFQTGDNVLIGGFIVYGAGQKRIAVRAIGPSLSIAGKLTDPMLELHDATGAIIASNDNWKSSQQSEITTAGLAAGKDIECALLATTKPRPFSVVVKGGNKTARRA